MGQLAEKLEALLQDKVKAGVYESVEQAVSELEHFMEAQQIERRWLESDETRQKIARGLKQLGNGEGTPFRAAEIIAKARQRHQQQQ